MRLRFPVFFLGAVVVLLQHHELMGQTDTTNYSNTPDELLPFGRFQDPYMHFFADPYPFYGPGREKTPPSDLETVRIGFLGPLEGSMDEPLGKQMLQGSILAVEEANAKGGYKGIPFEIMPHNDVGMWGAAANEVVKMDDEGVWAFLGSIDDVVSHVALRVALKLEIPMVNSGDPDPTFTETRIPWMIRVIGDDRQSSYALAIEIYKKRKITKVGVLRANNRYGRVGIGEFNDASTRMGYPLTLHVRYDNGDTDFTSQLERINNSSAQAIVLWTNNSGEAAMILQQMHDLGMKQPVFICDRIVNQEFLEKAGDLAEGIISTYPYNPTLPDPKLQAFNKNYRERFGEEPYVFAAHAYDGMNIIIESIHIAGLNRTLIRDVLTDLETFQGYHGVTGEIVFDASWNDIGRIWMVEVENGEFVFKPSPISDPKYIGSIRGKKSGN